LHSNHKDFVELVNDLREEEDKLRDSLAKHIKAADIRRDND